MKAIRLLEPGPIEDNPLRLELTADPRPQEGQLLLRVLASGICRTDLHIIEGDLQADHLPLTPGHQVVGEVTAIGTGVKGWNLSERAGWTLALNAIHMSPIPEFPFNLIWEERTLRSVANATYQDGVDFLKLAAEIPIRPLIERYPMEQANEALQDMKESNIDGAGVLIP